MLSKKSLAQTFANEYRKYYEVPLFRNEGFERFSCKLCGKGYWALAEQESCGDSAHVPYSFFREKPRSVTYTDFWKKFASFWENNGHTVIPRYPVVSRWRDDLPFTIASIVDFQRLEHGKVVFEYPANPLMVPQMCLRFPDIANIGVTGRHFSCFMMAGQHSFNPPQEGYWKDECLQYNFDFLTGVLGIPKDELIYGEDLWNMPDFSAFGPSMESFSRGLELVKSVLIQYRASGDSFEELDMKVIDVGWGFERLLWFYNGTPTAYDSVFAKPLSLMKKKAGFSLDEKLLKKYAALSAGLDVESVANVRQEKEKIANLLGLSLDELNRTISPLQAMYAIADHTRSVLFATADGALPSNTAGGYNLRVLLRRAFSFLNEYQFDFDVPQIMALHADDLKDVFPELRERLDDVYAVVDVEKRKYDSSISKATSLAREVVAKKEPLTMSRMVTLYESHGVTPEILEKAGIQEIPTDFYHRLTEKHVMEKTGTSECGQEAKKRIVLPSFPPTKPLYYRDAQLKNAEARVVYVDHKASAVVLDQTIFYPEGGGQAADFGLIQEVPVVDVQKQGVSVIHYLEDVSGFKEGDVVLLQVDWDRREAISRHHTATHIMIATARSVLGNHVWQHGSKKDVSEAHVDITHFEKPTFKQVLEMESVANRIVQEARTVSVHEMDRGEAEREYGFRLYQGGGAIGKKIRVVEIDDWDVEACGGIHRTATNQVGFIKITGVDQVQDGIIRLRYKAGLAAINHVQILEKILQDSCGVLSVSKEQLPQSVHRLFEEWKNARKDLEKLQDQAAEAYGQKLSSEAAKLKKDFLAQNVPFDSKGLEKLASILSKTTDCVLWNQEGFYVAATRPTSGRDARKLLSESGAIGGGSQIFARGKKA